MGIWACVLILFLEAAAAYLALDLVFRRMPVDPRHVRRSLRRWGQGYAVAAFLLAAAGGLAQWYQIGIPGAFLTPFNLLPWWAVWHHGVRKQFPFLWWSEGRQKS